jgi:hypothetical protein
LTQRSSTKLEQILQQAVSGMRTCFTKQSEEMSKIIAKERGAKEEALRKADEASRRADEFMKNNSVDAYFKRV